MTNEHALDEHVNECTIRAHGIKAMYNILSEINIVSVDDDWVIRVIEKYIEMSVL